ncbi:hypothetical protein CYMTET_47066 [Cymbomonas tetramitiformis]|uniref:Uncharacterized protein n=1 Tax=Cymbomonas tetramitiformis TaxID=36881 RepID=A0AAE0BWR9_9CHLO|nr:hypothetical protein CYMTET_54147 [Cymbomonas tetramitiformis]KAK3243270.1 hypothetical protein CYMTET_47066 [Cymbomonas tetramitiformis]
MIDADDVDEMERAMYWTPFGMRKVVDTPAFDKTLVKVAILFKWEHVGWQLGRIRKKLPGNNQRYNFQVYYACEDRVAKHNLVADTYVGGTADADIDDAPEGSWVAAFAVDK